MRLTLLIAQSFDYALIEIKDHNEDIQMDSGTRDKA